MLYLVQGCLEDHTLAATAGTAKEAFEKAVEWHIVARFTNVSIYDGNKIYSIDEFCICDGTSRDCEHGRGRLSRGQRR